MQSLVLEDGAMIFDLDGTLLDTAPDFVLALKLLAANCKRDCPDPELISSAVSNGARSIVRLLFPELQEGTEELEHQRDLLLELYAENLGRQSCPYPGALELIHTLDNAEIPWGVVTNKPEQFALPLLRNQGFEVPALCCPENVSRTKPDPEGLLSVCSELKSEPAHSLFVGDHPRDIECGHNAGMPTAIARWGYIADKTDSALAGWQADYVFEDCWEILDQLQYSIGT